MIDTDGLVGRLRERRGFFKMCPLARCRRSGQDGLCVEAADEIERLRREVASWKESYEASVFAVHDE